MMFGVKPAGTVAYMGGVWALPEDFTWSWGQMIQHNQEYVVKDNEYIYYDRARVSFHSFARNHIVSRMQGDWLLQLDTDIRFEPDLLARILQRIERYEDMDVQVLSGVYVAKGPPHHPIVYTKKDDGFAPIGQWGNEDSQCSDEPQLYEIAGAGGGVLWIKHDVFNKIYDELKEEPFSIIPPFSEDLSFFKRLEKLKIKAYFDPSIQVEHLGVRGYTLSDLDTKRINLDDKVNVQGLACKR